VAITDQKLKWQILFVLDVGSIVKLIGSEGADKNAITMVVLAFFKIQLEVLDARAARRSQLDASSITVN